MLVLSRKEGERIVIGGNVVVTVSRIAGNRITLAIDAPRDVRIVRGELSSFDSPLDVQVRGEKQGNGSVASTEEHAQCAAAMPFELELDGSLELDFGRVAG